MKKLLLLLSILFVSLAVVGQKRGDCTLISGEVAKRPKNLF